MAQKSHLHNFPARLAVGAYLLDSGLSKLEADEAALEHSHHVAVNAYPFLEEVESTKFAKYFAQGEIFLAAILLLPLVPDVLAGFALTIFAASLMGLYLRIPGMRRVRSLRATPDGIGLAKNIWILGIGLSLALTPYWKSENTRSVGRSHFG